MRFLVEIFKWFGCCLVLPIVVLFLGWPGLLFVMGFTKLTTILVFLGWYSFLIGTGIYLSDHYIGN